MAEGNYSQTIQRADEFLMTNARTAQSGRAYYLRGRAKALSHDTDGAMADLQTAIDQAKTKEVLAESYNAMGDVAYWRDDMALAENMYRRGLVYAEPHTPAAGHSNYRLGCVLQRQGRWSEADGALNKVIYHQAGTSLAGQASRRVHRDKWTIQVGAFSEKASADKNARQLAGRSLPAVARPESVDHSLLFVVQVGRYPTYEQAAADLVRVRTHQSQAFVTVTR